MIRRVELKLSGWGDGIGGGVVHVFRRPVAC